MSEKKQAPKEIQFSYGGQAVIEGVLMRGANDFSVAVRDPNGQIQVHTEPLNKYLYRGFVSRTPFLRGIIGLWDAMGLGTKALMWAADVASEEPAKEGEAPKEKPKRAFDGPVGWATVAISLLMGLGLFFFVPTAAATGIGSLLGIHRTEEVQSTENPAETATAEQNSFLGYEALPIGWQSVAINFIESLIRLAILVVYIWLISRMEDVKRLFGYHGAEHKTINAYEAGAELTPEIVAKYPIEHPRCGTAFLLTVVIVSFVVFALLGRPPMLWLIISRIVLIPVIAGISYELLRWSAANVDKPIVRFLITPNLMLQHLTTREPSLDMIEVAIVSFNHVLASEGIISKEELVIPPANPEAAHVIAG